MVGMGLAGSDLRDIRLMAALCVPGRRFEGFGRPIGRLFRLGRARDFSALGAPEEFLPGVCEFGSGAP